MDRADWGAGRVALPVDGSVEVSQAWRSSGVRRSGLGTAEGPAQVLHSFARGVVGVDAGGGAPAGVHDGRVIAPAEAAPDGGERFTGELSCEIHRELSGPGDSRRASAREKLLLGESEELAGSGLYLLHAACPASGLE